MAKNKLKKPGATNAFAQKKNRENVPKSTNPFEVHTNREKVSVLGRKLKHDKGMPGVSRGKSIKKRKETLGRELLQKNKLNKFKDSRVGKFWSEEDAASARFIAERLNQYKSKKQSRFNLNDNEEILTHKGQTLEELEQFQDTISDDDDDEIGKLDAEFTEMAHFGGKSSDGDALKRKTAIEDLIAEQKRRKAEISIEKETVFQLTNKLDENWKNLLTLMDLKRDPDEDKPKQDDFDRTLREMIFDRRSTVTDKLVSEDKLLKKEKARLERLERERLDRMHGITDEDKKAKHRSADDLDDGYFLQSEELEETPLAYNERGQANRNEDDSDEELDRLIALSRTNGNDVEQNGNGHGEDDEESGSEEGEEDEDEGEEGSSDDEESDEGDEFSDLVYDSDTEPELNQSKISNKSSPNMKKSAEKLKKTKPFTEEDRKAMMEKAEKELPYTFELSSNYNELENLLKKHNADYQAVILERMIKCNHPKVEPENRGKMVALFAYVLQYINDLALDEENVSRCFEILDRITPYLHDLSHLNPAETTKCFLEVIKEKQTDFRNSKQYPKLDTLVFLKLVSSLYSTSDFRHTIVSPCVIFISQILTRSRVLTRSDISSGLFLVTLILEYTQLSQRFLPAAVNFLAGTMFLSVKKRPIQPLKVIPPFKSTGEFSSLLVLNECTRFDKEQRLLATDLIETEIDNDFRLRAFNTTVLLTNQLLTRLRESNPGAQYLAQSFTIYLEKINFKYYPNEIKMNVANLKKTIQSINERELTYLVPEMRKPKQLRLMEPKFERIYDDKRNRSKNAGKAAVRKGLMRKIKSETKGAVREIRRDNAFLARVELKRTLDRDAERKEKVKRLFAEASIQQGELNALDRKKKHL